MVTGFFYATFLYHVYWRFIFIGRCDIYLVSQKFALLLLSHFLVSIWGEKLTCFICEHGERIQSVDLVMSWWKPMYHMYVLWLLLNIQLKGHDTFYGRFKRKIGSFCSLGFFSLAFCFCVLAYFFFFFESNSLRNWSIKMKTLKGPNVKGIYYYFPDNAKAYILQCVEDYNLSLSIIGEKMRYSASNHGNGCNGLCLAHLVDFFSWSWRKLTFYNNLDLARDLVGV